MRGCCCRITGTTLATQVQAVLIHAGCDLVPKSTTEERATLCYAFKTIINSCTLPFHNGAGSESEASDQELTVSIPSYPVKVRFLSFPHMTCLLHFSLKTVKLDCSVIGKGLE